MKRANNLIPFISDRSNLYTAFHKAQRGKSYSSGVMAYRNDLEANLTLLRSEILGGEVSVGKYRYFKVYEPKERLICASAFGEQVLHHALMNVCHPYFERHLIADTYASRQGKGVYACLEKAKTHTNRYRYFLKLDVRKFFDSIEHNVLKGQLSKLFKEPRLLNVFAQLIDSYAASPNRGLPIGNLTSQYFANHYLSALDHFIKEELKVKAYVRYMDDMVLWSNDSKALQKYGLAIEDFCARQLSVNLKPKLLNAIKNGLPFLGYVLFPHHVRLSQQSKRRFIYKNNQLECGYETLMYSETKCQSRFLPLIAFTNHADTHHFLKKILG